MKATRHNGRSGKNGTYNPKHNDRQFNVENSSHIDEVRAMSNVYWDCIQGLHKTENPEKKYESFAEIKQRYYMAMYSNHIHSQNDRNEKNRHTERNRMVQDLYENKKTCPEESILQIGNMEDFASAADLLIVVSDFFNELQKRYGENFHILDWALHVDEATPHIHERHVFDCENQYGEICPQQEKALEMMGIDLPFPEKKPGKNNNRKMVFDKICRELLLEICEKHKLMVDKDPVYGGKEYLEKQDYILEKQKERLKETEAALNEATIKLSEVDALIDEITDAAYEKACDIVSETVQGAAHEEDLMLIEESKSDTEADPKIPNMTKGYILVALEKVSRKIIAATSKVLLKIQERLHEPAVMERNKAEIRDGAREYVREKILKYQRDQERKAVNQQKKKDKSQER